MNYLELALWLCFSTIFYSYLGYGLILLIVKELKIILGIAKTEISDKSLPFEPEVTLLIAAYNEKDYVAEKVENSLALDYPKDKLKIVFVTDGSNDGTPEILKQFEDVIVLHENKRQGKICAINRAMKYVKTPIVIFNDANTNLNKEAVREIVYHYQDANIGGVSGEKRIRQAEKDSASGAGEGLYWRYESFLKRLDSDLYTVVGAAGELFSIRTELFEKVEEDTILDDFIISLRIAQKGFRVIYEPNAYALEMPSFSLKDELKRKVRICAGGFQAIVRLKNLLNPFVYRMLTVQYVSHRVLRWAVAPLALVALFPINYALMKIQGGIYTLTFAGQIAFYLLALLGWYYENKKNRIKIFFTPMYFCMMNLSAFLGYFRYIRGNQSVLWEKATRQADSSQATDNKTEVYAEEYEEKKLN